jgi:uncharacterized membrane protein
MNNIRRLILALSAFIGVWVLVSFAGAMFDSANAALWSNSLMWALLSSLIVMPALVMVNHASTQSAKKKAAHQRSASGDEQEPFIQNDADEARTLWPEPEQEADWPSQETIEEQERVRV